MDNDIEGVEVSQIVKIRGPSIGDMRASRCDAEGHVLVSNVNALEEMANLVECQEAQGEPCSNQYRKAMINRPLKSVDNDGRLKVYNNLPRMMPSTVSQISAAGSHSASCLTKRFSRSMTSKVLQGELQKFLSNESDLHSDDFFEKG
jgi:hypothetical protein